MLRAFLRIVGTSNGHYGYIGTPVSISTSDFDEKLKEAVDRFQYRNELADTSMVDEDTSVKIGEHWVDFWPAFEEFNQKNQYYPVINSRLSDATFQAMYQQWIDTGVAELGITYDDQFVAQVDPNKTREDLYRAWINHESNEGHWGLKANYRVVLGGGDNSGSIGFSQIQQRNKYGEVSGGNGHLLNNLYHPADNVKALAIQANTPTLGGGGGFFYAFGPDAYLYYGKPDAFQVDEFPRIGDYQTGMGVSQYDPSIQDRLNKGLASYNVGVKDNYEDFSWPDLLRLFPPTLNKDLTAQGIRYALKIKEETGIDFACQEWTWTDKYKVSTGSDGICDTDAHTGDDRLISRGFGLKNQPCICSGDDGIINTLLGGDDEFEPNGEFITTGENGICESEVDPNDDDAQLIDFGNGAPNTIAISAGADRILESSREMDDEYVTFEFQYSEEQWLQKKTWLQRREERLTALGW